MVTPFLSRLQRAAISTIAAFSVLSAVDPVLTISSGAVAYQANDPAAVIDRAALLTHASNTANVSGATLVVSIITTTDAGGTPVAPDSGDLLGITSGTVPVGVGISEAVVVSTNGAVLSCQSGANAAVAVASLTTGPGSDLTLTFTREATLPYTNAVLRVITFANARGQSAVVGSRTVGFLFTMLGGTAVAGQTTVAVVVPPTVPTATAGTLTAFEDQTATGTLSGSDQVGATLTYAVTTQPAHAAVTVLDGQAGTYQLIPEANWSGQSSFSFTVNNGARTSTSAIVTVTVVPVNDRPSFRVLGNQSALGDGQIRTVVGWAQDIDAGGAGTETGQTISFTATNNNSTLFAVQPAVAANGTLTYTPAPRAAGTATVTVVASDTGGTANSGADRSLPVTAAITLTSTGVPPIVQPVYLDSVTGVSVVATPTAALGSESASWSMVGACTLGTIAIDALSGQITLRPDRPGTETIVAQVVTVDGSTTFPIHVAISDPVDPVAPVILTTPSTEFVATGSIFVYELIVAAAQPGAVLQATVTGRTGATVTKTGGNTFRLAMPTTGFFGYVKLSLVVTDTTTHKATGQTMVVRVANGGGAG